MIDTLKQKDSEIEAAEPMYRETVFDACLKLIARSGQAPKQPVESAAKDNTGARAPSVDAARLYAALDANPQSVRWRAPYFATGGSSRVG